MTGQVTHIDIDEHHRTVFAMRPAHLGLALRVHVSALNDDDAARLVAFLASTTGDKVVLHDD